MGNTPSGWSPPPYTFFNASPQTGTVPGGATLLAAGIVDSNPAAIGLAVYPFNFAPVNKIVGLGWGAISFVNVSPFASLCSFSIEVINVPFNPADGQPTPPSTPIGGNVSLVIPPGFGVWQNIALDLQGIIAGPPAPPYYGIKVTPVEAGGGWITAGLGGPFPLGQWPLWVAWQP